MRRSVLDGCQEISPTFWMHLMELSSGFVAGAHEYSLILVIFFDFFTLRFVLAFSLLIKIERMSLRKGGHEIFH